jgi:hypothetical protein
MRTLSFPRTSEHPQVLKLKKRKASTTTQNEVNGTLLFRPQADLGTHSRVADAGNRTLNPRYLKKNSRRRDTSQDNRADHANADRKQLQPDFKLKVVTASFADLPQH